MEALVVDDSGFMRNMMKDILDDLSFDKIYEAENGQEAVEISKEEKPDLATMDIVMDEMGGIEALEKIKDQRNNVKVVMVSAVGQEEMVKEANELGAEEFVDKPFDKEDVKDTISEIMDLK